MNRLKFIIPTLSLVLLVTAFSVSGRSGRNEKVGGDSLPLVALKAKDFKGKAITSAHNAITLTTGSDNDYYEVDSLHKIGWFYIETRIGKYLNAQAHRVPLNISIVIDRSGSMEGIKMGNAKKAAKGIIDLLTPEDIVSIVIYDNGVDSVQIPVQVIDKEAIKKKIDGIAPRSATNLWGGCAKGYDYVLKNYKAGFVNRVLLISDGLANVGIVDPKIIRLKVQQFKDDSGITLSTFGVGLDYNESLMTEMAESGAGNYYFIDHPTAMTAIFARELNGMLDVSAQDAQITIQIPHGLKIIKGYPLKYSQNGDEITMRLRDLFSEETKGMVFCFSIPDRINSPLKLTTRLDFTDVADGQKKSLTNINTISPAKSADAYLTHFNRPVVEQTILFNANENLEKAMAKVDNGDYDGAREDMNRSSRYMKNYSVYTRNSDELKKMDSITKAYSDELSSLKGKNADSVKKIQKVNKAFNYKLRQKK